MRKLQRSIVKTVVTFVGETITRVGSLAGVLAADGVGRCGVGRVSETQCGPHVCERHPTRLRGKAEIRPCHREMGQTTTDKNELASFRHQGSKFRH